MFFGLPDFSGRGLQYEKLAELQAGQPGFPELRGAFPATSLTRYRLTRQSSNVELQVAQYGQAASAIVYPPATDAEKEAGLRHDLWQAAAAAIVKNSDDNALFMAWWDDGQRVRFLTGREPWLAQPVAAAFPDAGQQRFWRQAGGGFAADDRRHRQLARWLGMDAEAALAEMDAVLPKGRTVYWLLCLDDLARLGEIEALGGVKLPFEARSFPQADNIHAQIAEVRRWAGETGADAYLVQALPGGGVRAWRTHADGAKTLLARLLPFTSSLAQPLAPLALVYQSGWGGYLSVYQWRR